LSGVAYHSDDDDGTGSINLSYTIQCREELPSLLPLIQEGGRPGAGNGASRAFSTEPCGLTVELEIYRCPLNAHPPDPVEVSRVLPFERRWLSRYVRQMGLYPIKTTLKKHGMRVQRLREFQRLSLETLADLAGEVPRKRTPESKRQSIRLNDGSRTKSDAARRRTAEQLLAKTREAHAQPVQPNDREPPRTLRSGDRILLECEGPNGHIRQTPTPARATLLRGG
jgi:hypothetical protein